jgi:uncharacterized Tic20 family protein
MKKQKTLSDQLWSTYFLMVIIVLIAIGMSLLIPGMLSEKSNFIATFGVFFLFLVVIPAFIAFAAKLVMTVKHLIETKGKNNEKSPLH